MQWATARTTREGDSDGRGRGAGRRQQGGQARATGRGQRVRVTGGGNVQGQWANATGDSNWHSDRPSDGSSVGHRDGRSDRLVQQRGQWTMATVKGNSEGDGE